MNDIPWLQISGAIAGGAVGGFCGFVANIFQERRVRRRSRRNIACALIGELSALSEHIEANYLTMLRSDLELKSDQRMFPYHQFRGERDYMPIFRSLGSNVGYLPTPLPRDLVSWYTSLAAGLERAHALHELAMRGGQEALVYAIDLAKLQQAAFTELVATAKSLLARLDDL